MLINSGLRVLLSFFLGKKVLSIGTKYYPTNDKEREYVEMINYTETMLIEIKKADITIASIIDNLTKEMGEGNIPKSRRFIEIKAAENRVDEYALLSNIIMGSDRYLYVELFDKSPLITQFSEIIKKEQGTIVEQSSTEIVSKMLSKNDAIRVAIDLIRIGNDNDISVRAAAGMTGAAAIERSINLNKHIGKTSGMGFTKLGGEYAMVLPSKFTKKEQEPILHDNYLFIDLIDSTKFIENHGRDKLVTLMTEIKNFLETECHAKIEGYREGGDDFVANFPTKDLAMRAAIDCSWHALNNGALLRAGIGKSRREAGERAQLADTIKLWHPSTLIVFEMADGLYGYLIPSEFSRSIIDYFIYKKWDLILLFLVVFVLTYLFWGIIL